jgi:hypothetical protein
MIASSSIKELATALAKAQASMSPAKLERLNPHFKSKFAGLPEIRDVAKVLHTFGLAYTQDVWTEGESMEVACCSTTILHLSGEWKESPPLKLRAQQATPQGVGSALTYARRYSLAAQLGIVADEDDDGNEASAKPPQRANGNGQSKPPPVAAAPTSIWQKIQAMADDYGYPRGEKDADLIALTKAATKNKHGKDLTEADFIAVEIAMASAMVGTRKPEDDVRF